MKVRSPKRPLLALLIGVGCTPALFPKVRYLAALAPATERHSQTYKHQRY
jgi:hypothetical protein